MDMIPIPIPEWVFLIAIFRFENRVICRLKPPPWRLFYCLSCSWTPEKT